VAVRKWLMRESKPSDEPGVWGGGNGELLPLIALDHDGDLARRFLSSCEFAGRHAARVVTSPDAPVCRRATAYSTG
jgi:hypothetical protein